MHLYAVKPPTSVYFAVPGNLSSPTGGYAYARRVIAMLPEHGVTPHHIALSANYPEPSERDIDETRRQLAGVPGDGVLLIDGLAYGAMPERLVSAIRRPIVALVHHPLGFESGILPATQRRLLASERAALAHATAVIASSPTTARLLASEFAVPASHITIAEPGTSPAVRAEGTGHPLQLLAVGAVSPRKGYDVLVEALAPLAGGDWHLTIAGSAERDTETAGAVRKAILGAGLRAQVSLAGTVTDAELARLYARADVFVLSSRYEGYGMVLAEAMARGLAIVTTTGGAAAETVPDAAALKVSPDDAAALSAALARMLAEPDLRKRLGDASWLAGQQLPRWETTVARIAGVLKRVAAAADGGAVVGSGHRD